VRVTAAAIAGRGPRAAREAAFRSARNYTGSAFERMKPAAVGELAGGRKRS